MNTIDDKYCVYKHLKSDLSEPFYIGIGTIKRAYSKSERSVLWNRYFKKYGLIVEIIKSDITHKEAKEEEMRLIRQYGRIDNKTGILVNHTDGGEGMRGVIPSAKLINSSRIRAIENNPMKKQCNRDKASMWMKGRIVSNETKRKHYEKWLGKKPPFILNGTHYSRSGGDNNNARKVIDTISGTIYGTVTEAAKAANIKRVAFTMMLRGNKRNITSFKYYE